MGLQKQRKRIPASSKISTNSGSGTTMDSRAQKYSEARLMVILHTVFLITGELLPEGQTSA